MSATNRPTDHCYLTDNAQSDEHRRLHLSRHLARPPSGAFSSSSVARNSTLLRSIDSPLNALSDIFQVYADWIKPRPANVAERVLGPFRDIAAQRFVGSNRTQRIFDRAFKELSIDVQLDGIRLTRSEQ